MEDYQILGRVGEGAHGLVLQAKRIATGERVALKKLSLKRAEVPVNILREIKALQLIDSEYVVTLHDVFPQGLSFVLVFEFLPYDLSRLLRESYIALRVDQVKSYAQMLLKGVAVCHDLGIMHRDIKPANLLISRDGVLKIADFGLCRLWTRERPLSHQVATRWYRAPELLYGARNYDLGVDMWSVGCVFGELMNRSPLFPGENDIDQLRIVLHTLGAPTEETWPGMSELPDYNKISFPPVKGTSYEDICPDAEPEAIALLSCLLCYDSKKRSSAKDALEHVYFKTEPLPCAPDQMPRFDRESDLDSGLNRLGLVPGFDAKADASVFEALPHLMATQARLRNSTLSGN